MKIAILFLGILISTPLFSQHHFSSIDKVLAEKQKSLGGKVCMLVYKDGKIVYEKNIGGYTRNTREAIASCSKWFTAALVMTFVEEGKLSLEDTIGKFLPVFTKSKKGNIKIWQCLSNTTGLKGEEITLATLTSRSKYKTLEEEVNDFALRPMVAKPGEQFFYGNIGPNIAGRILEVISGNDFEKLFQERLAKPLEMTQTTFISKHAVNPSGSALSTPGDYMNFLAMILQNGVYKGKRILKEESIAKMEKDWTEKVKMSYVPELAVSDEYGLGAWILEKDINKAPTVLSSPGIFGTFPYVEKDYEYAAILFINTMQFKGRKETYEAIKEAVDAAMEE